MPTLSLNASKKTKHTPAGEIPVDWGCMEIGKLCSLSNGTGFGPKDWTSEGLPIIRIQNLNGSADFNYFSGTPKDSWIVEPGDLLFAWAGTRGASFGPTIWAGPRGVLNQHIFKVRPNPHTDQSWLYLSLRALTEEIEKKAHGFKSTLLHVGKKDITSRVVPVPPLPEQIRIAAILSTWDRVIETLESLIAAKDRRKQTLMQQLLTGRKRLPGFGGKWRDVEIGSLLKEVKRPVSWDDDHLYRLVSIRRRSGGFFFRDALYGRAIKTKVMNTTKAGDFTIAKMQVLHGAMAMTPPEFDGAHISDSYVTLVLKDSNRLHMPFFDWLSRTPRMYHLALISSYGVVIEKMTFVLKDFLGHRVSVPDSLEEQIAIVAFLESAERELALHRQHLEALRTQKRGLMQKLLTGQVRVAP